MEFEDSRDADDAVYELNGKDLCGERVIVEHARGPRRDREGYSSGFGNRSKHHLFWQQRLGIEELLNNQVFELLVCQLERL